MDLHEHLRLARAKIKPLTKEQRSERAAHSANVRWERYRATKGFKNPTERPTSAPHVMVQP